MTTTLTVDQIFQFVSSLSTFLTVVLSAGALVLGIFNYRNAQKGTDSALNNDLSEIANRELDARIKLRDEFDIYKAKTDSLMRSLQEQIDSLSKGEYEIITHIKVGKEPAILQAIIRPLRDHQMYESVE